MNKVERGNEHMHAKSKILYGLVFSLTSLTTRYYYGSKGVEYDENSVFVPKSDFRKITTGSYNAHTFKTDTGLLFVILTDIDKGESMDLELQYIYRQIYLNNVVLNPLAPLDYAETVEETRGEGFRQIENMKFEKELYSFLEPLL